MPPPDGGRDFLDFTDILGISVKMPKKNGNIFAEVIK